MSKYEKYNLARLQDDPGALQRKAWCFLMGDGGVEANEDVGMKLLEQAAKLGYKEA